MKLRYGWSSDIFKAPSRGFAKRRERRADRRQAREDLRRLQLQPVEESPDELDDQDELSYISAWQLAADGVDLQW